MKCYFKKILQVTFLTAFIFAMLSSTSFSSQHYKSISKVKCTPDTHSSQDSQSLHLDCKTYMQTTDYTCGPAAVMTLMYFYHRLNQSQMNAKTELRIALEMGATEKGVTMAEVTSWLNAHGFNVDSGIRIKSDDIIRNLKRGIPTMIAIDNHWILAEGFNKGSTPSEDVIYFSDSCCDTKQIAVSELDTMADAAMLPGSHCESNIGQYIVATPK